MPDHDSVIPLGAMGVATVVMICAVLLTGLLRRLALSWNMIDVPGDRSSHSSPTPRGGGLSIGILLVACLSVLFATGQLAPRYAVTFGAGAVLVSAIGWAEDRHGIPAAWRGVLYLAVCLLTVFGLGGLPFLDLGATVVELGIPGSVLAAIGLAWLVNLYNFMDGTDALAAVEGVSASLFAGLLFLLHGQQGPAWICLVLASACTGFLYWNLPPARIFMGDSGSCLLGFSFGGLAVLGERTGAVPVLAWIILLSIFICDATLTLLRRVSAGEKWYSPHRTHAYQLLAASGMPHGRIALWVMGINMLLLGPVALLAVMHRGLLLPAGVMVLIGTALLWTAVQFRPGRGTGTEKPT